jgi:hypothetical protein
MKRSFITILLACFYQFSFGQIEFGLKAGISSMDVTSKSLTFSNASTIYKLNLKDANYGHHLGLYGQVKLLGVFVQPAVLFNSNQVSYALEEYSELGIFDKILNERYYNVDLPVMMGMKVAFMRFYAGPVAHLRLGSSSDLVDIKGYDEKFNNATYGFQAGLGVNILKLRFDLSYEGNFSKFGNHIRIGDQQLAFDNGPSRVLGTISYKF